MDADNLMHIGSITCKYFSCITDAFDFYVYPVLTFDVTFYSGLFDVEAS